MKERSTAKRYGRAFFELALKSGDVTKQAKEMTKLCVAAREVQNFMRGLTDERVDIEKRRKAGREISSTLKLSKDTQGIFDLLILKKRLGILRFIGEDFSERVSALQKLAVTRASVANAELAGELKNRIEETIKKALQCDAKCDVEVDDSLIGGFSVWLGDMRYDASIKGKLDRMRNLLMN